MKPRAARTARRFLSLAAIVGLALAGVAIGVQPAAAQIAAALGRPLPSPDLPVGTISVRIVAGNAGAPVVGTDVTLLVNDTPRVARTDSAGRATFPGLPPGAKVVAKVTADKEDHASEEFEVPASGGTRVMITTKPWQAGAGGGAPFAGGGGAGMPNPRQLSGEARPEQTDPPGTITVRVAYDDFKDAPEGQPVTLVGYAADDSVSYQVVATDKAGRAVFKDLDRSGGTSYFAMTMLPRNGAVDRVMSLPVLLEAQVGVRMVLSSEKRDAKAPPIDDLNKADPQLATPAGKLRIVLDGVADATAQVSLVDVATRKVLGGGKPAVGAPDPKQVQGGAEFTPDAKLPAGTLEVEVLGGPGQTEAPLADVELRILAAASTDPTSGIAAKTGADGTAHMMIDAKASQKAVFTVNGRQLVSQPFELGGAGGRLAIRAHWESAGRLQALIDVAPTPGQVVYAECVFHGVHYRSLPVPLLDGTGSKVTVYVYPRSLLRFQLQSFVEDQLLAVQGKFEVTNYSWAPYRAGPDGMIVPLPHGFKGGVVFDPDQGEVGVAVGEGFRIIRPIPPGGRSFHGGFSLAVANGEVGWTLELPLGVFESELDIRKTPGMTVHTPPELNHTTQTVRQGTFSVIAPISLRPRSTMTLTIDGLPSEPAWHTWVGRLVGVLVVLLIAGGVGYALRRPAITAVPATALAVRRKKLLDELVELERSGSSSKRKDQVLGELEGLWD